MNRNEIYRILFGTNFCACSGNSLFELLKKSPEQIQNGTRHIGMKQIVSLPFQLDNYGKINDLGPEGKDLVNWCIDFLQLEKRKDKDGKSDMYFQKHFYEKEHGWFKIHSAQYHIGLYEFIRFFLKIESGYDFFLLNFLEWNRITEHGFNIRGSWLSIHYKPPKTRRHVKKERKHAIFEWVENIPEKFDYNY